MWILIFLLTSAFAQDLPRYVLPPILVTPSQGETLPDPDLVVEIPANATPKAATVDDVLRGVPGVIIAREGGQGQRSALFFRGSASEHTLVLVDGVEVNDPGQPTGGFDFSTIDLNLVDRVEVYKGPQALRFGSGAVGGVINIISKKGGGKTSLIGALRGGSHQTNQESAVALGEVGALRYSASVARFESEGISAARGEHEKDGHRYIAGALRLSRGDPDNEWEFINRTIASRTDLDFSTSTTGPFFIERDDPNYFVDNFHTVNAIKHHGRFEEWTSEFSASLFYLDRRYENKPDQRNPAYFLDHRFAHILKVEKIFARRLGSDTNLSLGPTFREETSKYRDSLLGSFAEIAYKKKWQGSAGIRFDNHSRYGSHWTYAVQPGYRWSQTRTTLSGRLATAFKSPSLFQLHDPQFGNSKLQPEKVRGEEISVEQLIGVSHALKITGFRYFYSDLIQFSSRYQNLSSAKTEGVEIEYRKEMNDHFDLQLAYTYADSRNEQTGARLIRRPFNSWRAGLGVQFSDSLAARAEYRGVGARPDIDAVSASPNSVAAYDVLDLSVTQVITPKTQLTLSLENAFDKNYEEISGYGTSGFGLFAGIRSELL